MRVEVIGAGQTFDFTRNLFGPIVTAVFQAQRHQGATVRLELIAAIKQLVQITRVGFAARDESVDQIGSRLYVDRASVLAAGIDHSLELVASARDSPLIDG